MLIFIYSRKSLYTKKGRSVENQVEMCKEYIFRTISDIKPEDIVVYEDEDFTGKDTDRPQFQKMMNDIKKKKPNFVICYMVDRISRSVNDFSTLVESLISMQIDFISVKEQFDTSTPVGRAMMYMTSVFAQLERETLAERVRDNMLMLSRSGIWLGGVCPTGFTSERKTNVIIDDKIKEYSYLKKNDDIEIVKLIFNKFLECGSTLAIAKYLDKEGIKNINNHFYYDSTIKNILRNPVYCTADKDSFDYFKQKQSEVYFEPKDFSKGLGIMPFNRNNFKLHHKYKPISEWIIALGKHKGVISGKDWVEAQNILSKNKSFSRTRKSPALLSGVIYCQTCGSKMQIRLVSNKNLYYYVCVRKKTLGKDSCNSKNLNGVKIDEQVINYIMNFDENKLKKDLNIRKYTRKVNKFDDKLDEIKCEIEKLENKKHNLFKYLEKDDGTSFFKDLKTRINTINTQIQKLEVQKQNYQSQFNCAENEKTDVEQILKNLRFFKTNFHNLDFDAKKSLLRLVVNKLTWNGQNLKILLNGEKDVL